MLLRLVHGRWPIADPPASALDAFHRDIVQDYDAWLRDLRGLQPQTRAKRTAHALRFLASLGPRAPAEQIRAQARQRQEQADRAAQQNRLQPGTGGAGSR